MARSKGVLKISGALGGLSFYSSVFGDIVRQKGGASKEKIRKSPAFANLRKHQSEFSNCAAAGKLFRQALRVFSQQAPDHTLVWRCTKLMNQIKDLDASSAWGKRSVANGLATAEGKNLLSGFNFNQNAPLNRILKLRVKAGKDLIELKGLVPKFHLVAPAGATHATLTGIFTRLDLDKNTHTVQTDMLTLKLDKTKRDLVLRAPVATKGKGMAVTLLLIRFSQETNALSYQLKNKGANGLGVVAVE